MTGPHDTRRKSWPWVVAALTATVLAGCGASEESSLPATQATTRPAESQSEKDARAWIKEHGFDAKRVQASVQVVQIEIGMLKKSETEAAVNEVAQSAQSAHDHIDEIRNDFANGETGGAIEHTAVEVFSSANGLKNAMGAMVAYTGNPNPATLAHFTSQYTPAKEEWNEGVKTIWRLAHEPNPPTI